MICSETDLLTISTRCALYTSCVPFDSPVLATTGPVTLRGVGVLLQLLGHAVTGLQPRAGRPTPSREELVQLLAGWTPCLPSTRCFFTGSVGPGRGIDDEPGL